MDEQHVFDRIEEKKIETMRTDSNEIISIEFSHK